MGSVHSGGGGQSPVRSWPFRNIPQDTKGREAELGRRDRSCWERLLRGRHVIRAFCVFQLGALPTPLCRYHLSRNLYIEPPNMNNCM